jgi:hypothetical protein
MRDERRQMMDDRNGRKKDKKIKKIGFLTEISKIGARCNGKNNIIIGLICF